MSLLGWFSHAKAFPAATEAGTGGEFTLVTLVGKPFAHAAQPTTLKHETFNLSLNDRQLI